MNLEDCIFCKIVKKEIPSKILYENEKNLAFLDIFPINDGHTIVIPKNHYQNIDIHIFLFLIVKIADHKKGIQS